MSNPSDLEVLEMALDFMGYGTDKAGPEYKRFAEMVEQAKKVEADPEERVSMCVEIMNGSGIDVEAVLVLAAQHLEKEVFDLVQNEADGLGDGTYIADARANGEGIWLWVDYADALTVHPQVETLFAYARKIGCSRILLDRDGIPTEALPLYDWEE